MTEEISLTGPQQEAVNHSAGRMRVIACPGSTCKLDTIFQRCLRS
jgi:superfamily I DNA/RNA helicase